MPHSTQTFVGDSSSVSLISGIDIFMHKKGMTQFFVGSFLSHSTKNFVRERFCVSESFWYRKTYEQKGGGRECHKFPSKVCGLRVSKNFVGEQFCVSENFWYGEK